jgi:hypothetical protein
MGGYSGLTKSAFLIKINMISTNEENSPFCDTVQFIPWPEMENGGSGRDAKSR